MAPSRPGSDGARRSRADLSAPRRGVRLSPMRIAALGGSLLVLALASAQPATASTLRSECAEFGSVLARRARRRHDRSEQASATPPDASFLLPATAALTIEGAPEGINGFNGGGKGGAALESPYPRWHRRTHAAQPHVRELQRQRRRADQSRPRTATHPFAFVGDTFTHDTSSEGGIAGNGGGLAMIVGEPGTCAFAGARRPVTLAGSTFSFDTAAFQAGGGAFVDLECGAGTISASITGNVFAHDRVLTESEPRGGRRPVRRARPPVHRRAIPGQPAGQPLRSEQRRAPRHDGAPHRRRRRVHRRRRRDQRRRPLHRQRTPRRDQLHHDARGRRPRGRGPRRMHEEPRGPSRTASTSSPQAT